MKKKSKKVILQYINSSGAKVRTWFKFIELKKSSGIINKFLDALFPKVYAGDKFHVPTCRAGHSKSSTGVGFPSCENDDYQPFACEDMFSLLGDADYNDLVANFRVEYLQTGVIILRIKWKSNGADLHQSLGFNFPDYSSDDVLSVEGAHNIDSSALTFNSNGTESRNFISKYYCRRNS